MFTTDTLKQKTVLVTGGGSGLGLAMAQAFCSLGAKVVVCGRDSAKLIKALDQLLPLGEAIQMQCDVRDYEAVGQMFEQVSDTFGTINCLVNNAAGNFLCPSEELSPNAFKTVVDIVLHGTFNCSQHFARSLIAKRQPGSILNITTTYTETGSSFVLPSACAKAGVYALTNSLAYEWAPYGIRVNAIAPGPFPTDGAWARLVPGEDFEAAFKATVPVGRFGDPGELANLAAFLLSDLAPYITGECVTIDGEKGYPADSLTFWRA